ncbi:MAG: hypothetical protein V3W41_21445 [Planctomycetota bacterium]
MNRSIFALHLRSHFLFTALGLTLFASGLLAQQPLNTELLQNGGFETGDTTGWTAAGGTIGVLLYGDPNTPDTGVAVAMGGASFIARCSTNSSSATLTQSFDLNGNAVDVDAGNLALKLAGFFGGNGSDNDRATLTARFLDASSALIDTLLIGDITRTNRNAETTLMRRSGDIVVPAGTRTLEVEMRYARFSGLGLDSLADNLSAELVLAAAAIPAAIALNLELLDNAGFETGAIINPALESAWTVRSGAWQSANYGDAELPTAAIATAMGGGAKLALCITDSSNPFMTQTFDLRGNAADIDAGNIFVDLEGYFGGFVGNADTAELNALFFDASAAAIPSADLRIGQITATNRNQETTVMRRSSEGQVPVGARSMVIELRYRRLSGLGVEAFADRLAVKLTNAPILAPLALDTQLINNPGFGAIELIDPAIESSWTVSNALFAAVAYGDVDLPSVDVSAAINGGSRLLRCSTDSSVARIGQSLDLRGNAVDVDNAALYVELAGHFGGSAADPDRASMRVIFFDDTDTEIVVPSTDIGAITRTNRNDETTVMRRSGNFAVPVGARRMLVEIELNRLAGLSLDALVDNVFAALRHGPLPVPGTTTFTEIVDRGDFEDEFIINPNEEVSWTVTNGGFISVPYGDPNQPSMTIGSTIGGGLRLVSDRLGGSVARMEHRYPVASDATSIDLGQAEFSAEAYLGGEGSQPDHAKLEVLYLDASGATLLTDTIGPVTNTDRGNVTDMLFREGCFTVPAGTREIVLKLVFTRLSGLSNEAHADNISARFDIVDNPGSNEDLRFLTSLGGPLNGGAANDIKFALPGDVLTMQIDSPGGTRNFQPLVLVGHLFTTGSPPLSPGGFPTVCVNPTTGFVFILLDGVTPQGVFGPPVVFPGGTIEQVLIPLGGAGLSVNLQAFALDGSAANGFFATTDCLELRLQ